MKKVGLIIGIIFCTLLIAVSITVIHYYTLLPKFLKVEVSEINENNQVTITVTIEEYANKNVYCQITTDELKDENWISTENSKCSFDVDTGNYKIYLKNKNEVLEQVYEKQIQINKILNVTTERELHYLAVGETRTLENELLFLGEVDETITYEYDETIISIENNVVKGLKNGTAEIKIKTEDEKVYTTTKVIVTNLIKKQYIDNSRAKVGCNQYTTEEAHLLDEILFERIDYVGEGTRAGAVEAARFLSMSMPYKIPYFFENGRLNNHPGRPRADGEGRYYHKGLYLSEDKIESIEAIAFGPAIWGCPLMNYQTEAGFIAGVRYPNGLSCSGFISWALYNGGFDVGDSGAGDFDYRDDDLSDLGERVTLTYDLMKSGKVRVGDLIGRDAHIAMIVGLDEKNIYIAESLANGVVVETFERYRGVVDSNLYEYIMLMDSVYKEDGRLTDMWTN